MGLSRTGMPQRIGIVGYSPRLGRTVAYTRIPFSDRFQFGTRDLNLLEN